MFDLCLLVSQDQEAALEESERRMAEVQKEREKEAEVKRRRADELKQLLDREDRSCREKEVRGGPLPVFNIVWKREGRAVVWFLSPAAGTEGGVSAAERGGGASRSPGDKVHL